MARPKRTRRINNPPHFKGFRPIGLPEENDPVVINYEEYEAIRLSDFELNGHVEASKIMGISRPTYTRIYESARRKVAQAFVQGRAIVFEGGKVYFDSDWYSCHSCGCWFNRLDKEVELKRCSLCGSAKIEQYIQDSQPSHTGGLCRCPACGFEKIHNGTVSAGEELCPTCNNPMNHLEIPQKGSLRKGTCNENH
jgi:predicted DNA-binding protein (UPF0251 family)